MSVTGHKNIGSLDSYIHEPSSDQRSSMCHSLHKFGKGHVPVETDSLALVPSATGSADAGPVVPSTSAGSDASVVVSNTQESVAVSTQRSVFFEANFNGSTTINVQINPQ